MATLTGIVFALAMVSSLGLAAVALAQRPRGRLQWSFAAGMTGFVAEALAALVLLMWTELAEDRLLWLRGLEALGFLVLIPWGLFVAALAHPDGSRLAPGWRVVVAGSSAVALTGSAGVLALPAFDVADIPGAFVAARLDPVGQLAVIGQLLVTAAVLGGLEVCLRTSKGVGRWRVKYLVLGLGGIFLIRFYLLSQTLLFGVLMAVYPPTATGTLFLGNLVIAATLARGRPLGTDLTVSRQVLYRSVVVGMLGLYLLVVGALGWLMNYLGIPEELFWGALAVFVSAVGLAAILLSEDVRWRLKRYIARHFYRSKHDYREQWVGFTKRLGSLLTVEELAPQLLGAVTEAVGTTRGVLYLADERYGGQHLAGTVGVDRPPSSLEPDSPMVATLRTQRTPFLLGNGGSVLAASSLGPGLAEAFSEGSVAVPLHWRGNLTGLMLLGPERTGAAYTVEDLEFLGTMAEQAAGAIVTANLSEAVAQGREFEAFHRLTSFVIHDLKNSISALSILSQNALANFDDPEFQRDAIKTLSRTVERMKALLARLSSAPETAALRFEPVDLAVVVTEATRPLKGGPRVTLVKELVPVPPVSGDVEALVKVVQNLVTNAVEAVDGQGTVSVKLDAEPGWVVLSVSDTGCGMSQEFVRKSLFAPFRSTKKGGWGLGLYQAKGIIRAHGGRIDVMSREGDGTTFWVRLPARPAPSERAGS